MRSERYGKLRHEKNKEKKKRRRLAAKEAERAEQLGIELPAKPVPKARAAAAPCWDLPASRLPPSLIAAPPGS